MSMCILNQNILRTDSCNYSLPQIVDIYLVNYDDISGFSEDISGDCKAISGMDFVSGAEAYKITPAKDSASFTDELQVGDGGNKFRAITLTFNVNGAYTSCRKAVLDQLSLGRYIAFITTANGETILLNKITPLEATSGNFGGGSGDLNGMTFTLTANIAESSTPLTEDGVAALKAKVHA